MATMSRACYYGCMYDSVKMFNNNSLKYKAPYGHNFGSKRCSKLPILEIDVYVWRYALIAVRAGNE